MQSIRMDVNYVFFERGFDADFVNSGRGVDAQRRGKKKGIGVGRMDLSLNNVIGFYRQCALLELWI